MPAVLPDLSIRWLCNLHGHAYKLFYSAAPTRASSLTPESTKVSNKLPSTPHRSTPRPPRRSIIASASDVINLNTPTAPLTAPHPGDTCINDAGFRGIISCKTQSALYRARINTRVRARPGGKRQLGRASPPENKFQPRTFRREPGKRRKTRRKNPSAIFLNAEGAKKTGETSFHG